jgi:uncharacterized protein YrrD
MLQSIRQLYGTALIAGGHEIGCMTDFYFDDEKWCVRYIVVNAGSWLSGRAVLISPHALGSRTSDGKSFVVNLTPQQIEGSPSIESHKPVSRQYEEEYYRYYGWPSYWNGVELWGASGFPVAPQPPYPVPCTQASAAAAGQSGDEDSHLRSTQTIVGYHIQTTEETIGHITDLMVDNSSWAIRNLVVETGHWYSGKEVAITQEHVERISFDASKVYVDLTKEAIQRASQYRSPRSDETH